MRGVCALIAHCEHCFGSIVDSSYPLAAVVACRRPEVLPHKQTPSDSVPFPVAYCGPQ
jgi:hypothetical protein